MKLFSFIKRKLKKDPTAVQRIRGVIEYMPDFYKTHRQFLACTEYLDYNEWGLALDSLIQLADETGHYFSEEFWLELAAAADTMKLAKEARYCKGQIKRNQKKIGWKMPFGSTTVKIDDTHFEHHVAEKIKDKNAIGRREKDSILELQKKDGVYLKSRGRGGCLYVVENGRVAEVDLEFDTDGIFLYFSKTTNWVLPIKQDLSQKERQDLKNSILGWAAQKNEKIKFDE